VIQPGLAAEARLTGTVVRLTVRGSYVQRALAHRHLRGSLAGGLTFNISHDLHDTGQVLLDAADDLRINVLEVVVLHPLLAQIFFQVIDIEHEL